MATRQITDDLIRIAVAALRAGRSQSEAAAAIGFSDRALRKRLAAVGIQPSDLMPAPPLPAAVEKAERRRRLRALGELQRWQHLHDAGAIAYATSQQGRPRRDLHLMLSETAWQEVHEAAASRQCSMSSLVADVLYEAGIISEP